MLHYAFHEWRAKAVSEPASERQRLIPVSVQFTPNQLAWIDARAAKNQTFSRAAEVRALVAAAIESETKEAAVAA